MSAMKTVKHKDEVKEWAKHLKDEEEKLHEAYKADARKLLIRKGAEDLVPMLLDE
jgi:hypothetical protein